MEGKSAVHLEKMYACKIEGKKAVLGSVNVSFAMNMKTKLSQKERKCKLCQPEGNFSCQV
jgi:hypothetical protein